ncbi:hypothetical protein PIB30_056667 [Stylosanthes scabra]|uniref:RRM domain-containing protein n=1 Tax=Stylosanthes scabra TaxID=79078 RepID=A0ABU6WLE3_9FABA|nr:hypothetical protein [Stylosanthes scabra]
MASGGEGEWKIQTSRKLRHCKRAVLCHRRNRIGKKWKESLIQFLSMGCRRILPSCPSTKYLAGLGLWSISMSPKKEMEQFDSRGRAERAVQKINGTFVGTSKMTVKFANFQRGVQEQEAIKKRRSAGRDGKETGQ